MIHVCSVDTFIDTNDIISAHHLYRDRLAYAAAIWNVAANLERLA
jgi:hypothetical protein